MALLLGPLPVGFHKGRQVFVSEIFELLGISSSLVDEIYVALLRKVPIEESLRDMLSEGRMEALALRGPEAGDHRPLTVTGGLAFFGGPGNNYMTHSVAAMVDACRRDPGSYGLVTGVGWFLTKHSVGLYSTRPPAAGFTRVDPAVTRSAVEAGPRRHPAGAYTGPATVEATAVQFTREGEPAVAVVSTLTPEGARALANTSDPDVLASMVAEEWAGRTVELRHDGRVNTLGGETGA